uniref:Developmental pluripotency-associated protein 2 n=1 Tax=Angiostrongylus cantonensis TaxID=6313 RepID=A0A0K0CZU0_ANGCA
MEFEPPGAAAAPDTMLQNQCGEERLSWHGEVPPCNPDRIRTFRRRNTIRFRKNATRIALRFLCRCCRFFGERHFCSVDGEKHT